MTVGTTGELPRGDENSDKSGDGAPTQEESWLIVPALLTDYCIHLTYEQIIPPIHKQDFPGLSSLSRKSLPKSCQYAKPHYRPTYRGVSRFYSPPSCPKVAKPSSSPISHLPSPRKDLFGPTSPPVNSQGRVNPRSLIVGSNFREEGLAVKRERRAKGAKGQKQRKGKTNTHYYFWSFRTQLDRLSVAVLKLLAFRYYRRSGVESEPVHDGIVPQEDTACLGQVERGDSVMAQRTETSVIARG
ncbi:hypothetical protein M430DRAFT_24040 [Amorphotheca resinae ATCC 22711]|uniref:Uncharacterized protein n=1 Tax=Amorphotheca resinae ATCC 22711 TaxID=857342 RepID=A0A2T3BDY7_AMORE|nr:hypothetical protein M430DRAFT_24040 [Amorphotheca resinae ATCC 22711]PSS27606.1 hypothetical protein M430DRAFT_24040 [Amorphotheca resinae ATCC 22711]